MHHRIVHDAKEFAGAFFDNNRSEAFRKTWPSQDDYVAAKWHHFVEGVRGAYAELLARPDVPQDDKDRVYDALVADAPGSASMGAPSPLQLIRNTEAFVGDRGENTRTKETFGSHARSNREKWRSTTALFPTR